MISCRFLKNDNVMLKLFLYYVEIYRVAQNTEDHFKKNMAFPEGNKLFAGDFRANLDETNADMVQSVKRWNWKWIV